MNSTTAVTQWIDKSGQTNNMTGSGTWSGSNMVFNGSTNAFSNTTLVFPHASYSLFAVYSNTVAPGATAYMNAVYGSNGYPMLGVFGSNRYVSARSVVANTGALTTSANAGWTVQISGLGRDQIRQICADSNGNVYLSGDYHMQGTTGPLNMRNANGSIGVTLPNALRTAMLAKYSPSGSAIWGANICVSLDTYNDTIGFCVTTDQSGSNIFTTSGYHGGPLLLCNATYIGGTGVTLPHSGTSRNTYIAKYSSDGISIWGAQLTTSNAFEVTGLTVTADFNGNVFIAGVYQSALTLNNAVSIGGTSTTLSLSGTSADAFIAKYSSNGTLVWAAKVTSGNSASGSRTATDSAGNVYLYVSTTNATVTFSNGTASTPGSMSLSGSNFTVKYSPTGTVLWAVALPGGASLATDSNNNVFVAYAYTSGTTTVNNATLAGGGGGGSAVTLPFAGGASDVAIVKYSSSGTVLWAAGLGGAGGDSVQSYRLASDSDGNVFISCTFPNGGTINNATAIGGNTSLPALGNYIIKYSSSGIVMSVNKMGNYPVNFVDSIGNGYAQVFVNTSPSFLNSDGTTAASLTITGDFDSFIAKYSPAGFITSSPVLASSNVMVSATYPSPTALTPFTNGVSMTALAGTTLATTGLFVGGPSNYFNGTVSELLLFSNALSFAQRQSVEGYLANKWGLRTLMPLIHPFYSLRPSNRGFSPLDIPGCALWLDGADATTVTLSGSNVSQWTDKSGNNYNATASRVGLTYTSAAINSKNAIFFPGAPTYSFLSGTVTNGTPNITFFIIATAISTMPQYTRLFGFGGAADFNNIGNMTTGWNTAGGIVVERNQIITPTTNPIISAVPFFTTITVSGTSVLGYINGTNSLTGTTTSTNFTYNQYGIGAWTGADIGYEWHGHIGEIIVYNAALTTTQRQTIEGYLAWKWGITATVGTAHPYKTLPPTTSQPAQFSEVSPGNWTHDWQPYLQALTRANSNAVASFSSNSVTGAAPGNYAYIGGVLAPNGKIYCIPYGSTSVGVIDPVANTISQPVTGTPPVSYSYYGAVLAPNGKIYCNPTNGTSLGVIDPNANTLTTFGTAPGSFAYTGGVLAPNGKIYCVPCNATSVGVIDPVANTFTTPVSGTAPGGVAYVGGVLAPNGKIYCVPCNATSVGVIDPVANTFTAFGTAPGGVAYSGGVLAPNGKIYCIPSAAVAVGVIDPTVTPNTFTTFGTAPGSSAYAGGVLAPNGKIYCIPSAAVAIGVIDPVANTFTTFGTAPGSSAYAGGVLAPNGKIYCIPANLTSVGVISFSGLNQFPSLNYCLSAWANKL
jgi:hypothetical protein